MKYIILVLNLLTISLYSQTDIDGLFMDKNMFCSGIVAGSSNFDHYWEGNLFRDNLNMGTVSNSFISVMGNYGLTDKLNLIASAPYISTNATAGNMQGQKGFQDLSLFVKYAMYKNKIAKGDFQIIGVGGISIPMTDYLSDIVPLSIGLHSNQALARLILDYENQNYYITASGSYMYRDNIKLDRNTYYTDRMHYSNEVEMPNATLLNLRTGYRNEKFIADVFYEYFNTIGGFDIPRNGMPFPSNDMEAHKLGIYFKVETPVNGLSILGSGFTTFTGRNMGRFNGFNFGAFYILDFNKKAK